jgi:flagellar basal-body rod modification protein FlgD
MTTTPATSATTAGPTTGTEPAAQPGMLGQNDFLKLMIAQLQAQDPLQPANTNEYISELAQFTQVEQMTNLASATELTGAVQLIGRNVTYRDGSGSAHGGKVESVQSNASGTTLTVEGQGGVSLQSVTEVQ